MNKEKAQELLGVSFIEAQENWKMLCPFHDEASPSFFIHKTELICNCFGCGVSGSIEGIIWRLRNIPPSESRQILDIDRLPGMRKRDVDPKPTTFSESWLGPWKRISSSSYLVGRGFTQETIEAFGTRIDQAAKRIVFPLRPPVHYPTTLVGAAGRSYIGAEPKWLFYWNCQKSKNLYRGPFIPPKGPLYVVEGIFDVMWLWQHGYPAVGLLGSKASSEQVKQIKDITTDVVIALDNDEAGRLGGEMLGEQLKTSCNVMYTDLPVMANDVCDIDGEQLHKVLLNPITPLEKKLNVPIL